MVWIPELGVLGLCVSLAASFLAIWDKSTPNPWVAVQALATLWSFLLLMLLFYMGDFSVAYVAHNASTTLPWYYRLSATWGAHEGSFLLWILWLNIWTLVAQKAAWPPPLKTHANRILCTLNAVFVLFLLFTSNPFLRMLPHIPTEGGDLNPLLQDFGLIIHPPILYAGLTGFAIPFAVLLASLSPKYTTRLSLSELLKPWVAAPLAFLTVGITLGSWWAYYELGWGGFWFWDPVENASLMPWLSGLSLLHILYVNKRNNSYKNWVVALSILTFSLCLLGTFLVRSGILSSVHAFASDPSRGVALLLITTALIGGSSVYAVLRLREQDNGHSTPHPYKLKLLLLACLLILASLLTVLLATLYPLVLDALFQQKISIGPPYFNATVLPFWGILALLCGVLMLTAYPRQMKVIAIISLLLAGIGAYSLVPATKATQTTLGLGLGLFVALSTLIWFIRTPHARTHMRAWGVLMAHQGFALLIAGLSLQSALSQEYDTRLTLHETKAIGPLTVTLENLTPIETPHYQAMQATLNIQLNTHKTLTLKPEKRFYKTRQIAISETAIHPRLTQEIYVALAEPINENTEWIFRIYLKPWIRAVWLGGLLMALGLAFILIKIKRKNP